MRGKIEIFTKYIGLLNDTSLGTRIIGFWVEFINIELLSGSQPKLKSTPGDTLPEPVTVDPITTNCPIFSINSGSRFMASAIFVVGPRAMIVTSPEERKIRFLIILL